MLKMMKRIIVRIRLGSGSCSRGGKAMKSQTFGGCDLDAWTGTDAGGAGLVLFVLLGFMFIAILLEAIVMMLMKYNKPGKAFLDSLVINLVSLALGYLVIYSLGSLDFTDNEYLNLLVLYLLTVLTEAVCLYFLNRSKPVNKTILTAFAINIISYLGLFILKFN